MAVNITWTEDSSPHQIELRDCTVVFDALYGGKSFISIKCDGIDDCQIPERGESLVIEFLDRDVKGMMRAISAGLIGGRFCAQIV